MPNKGAVAAKQIEDMREAAGAACVARQEELIEASRRIFELSMREINGMRGVTLREMRHLRVVK